MPDFTYAKGRVGESLQFISQEMMEFSLEYAAKTWGDYHGDKKLQKLMDRTVENILTALIEISGSILSQKGIGVENYAEALKGCARIFGFSEEEQIQLAKLAAARNRLAHRYLNLKWQTISSYSSQSSLIQRLLLEILKREEEGV